jgi:plastocyanin
MRRIILALSATALVAGCSSGFNHPVHEVTATLGSDHVQHVRVVTHSFWYEPNRIVVTAGTPVELTIHNHSWFVPHNFTCTEPEAGISVMAGVGIFHRTVIVSFTPTHEGEYEFRCHEDEHAKKGMKGTLVVKAGP